MGKALRKKKVRFHKRNNLSQGVKSMKGNPPSKRADGRITPRIYLTTRE